jgi:hypothetical protein
MARNDEDSVDRLKKAMAYSGIGFQTLVTILGFFYFGRYMDERSEGGETLWTLGMTLAGVVIALYFLIKGLLSVK